MGIDQGWRSVQCSARDVRIAAHPRRGSNAPRRSCRRPQAADCSWLQRPAVPGRMPPSCKPGCPEPTCAALHACSRVSRGQVRRCSCVYVVSGGRRDSRSRVSRVRGGCGVQVTEAASDGRRTCERRGTRREGGTRRARRPHRCGCAARAAARSALHYACACPCRRSATRIGCCSALHDARSEESWLNRRS